MDRNKSLKADIATVFFVAASAFFFILTCLRVANIPVTHDEAFTYYTYIEKSFQEIFEYKDLYANNHFLNTIFSKSIVSMFGNSMVAIRLINLLALIVFLIYSFKLLRLIFNKSQPWLIAGFVLISTNMYLLEFWGLCRGYGLSISFMVAACYYIIRYITGSWKSLLVGTLFAIAAVYANFVMLNFFLAFFIITLIQILWKINNKEKVKGMTVILIGTIILALLIYKPISILKETQNFYYGGDRGVIADTLRTLIQNCFHIENVFISMMFAVIVFILFAVAGIYWISKYLKKDKLAAIGIIIWLLFSIPILSEIVQYYMLGTKYLIGRTALFLYPLFMLQFIFWMYHLYQRNKEIPAIIVTTLCVICVATFSRNINITHTTDWSYDRYNLEILDRIVKDSKKKDKILLRVSWPLSPSIVYHTVTDYPGVFMPVEKKYDTLYKDTQYDYAYLSSWPEVDDMGLLYGKYEQDTVLHFKGGYNVLYNSIDGSK